MAGSATQFDSLIADELEKYGEVSVPLRASALHRMLVRRVKCSKLHPNPEDEFCDSNIGPSHRIISEYEKQYMDGDQRAGDYFHFCSEPVVVQKMYPDGYMILNGHHRWAAATRIGIRKIPVRVVNVTRGQDVLRMLKEAKNEKRVTLDLDEVVFCAGEGEPEEKALAFPFRNLYPERLRRGIPALFHFLTEQGYDIWVYSSNYYSMEYISALFRKYHVHVAGIVTGAGRKSIIKETELKELRGHISQKYRVTLHIDRSLVLKTENRTGEYMEYPLSGGPSGWTEEIKAIIREMKIRETETDET